MVCSFLVTSLVTGRSGSVDQDSNKLMKVLARSYWLGQYLTSMWPRWQSSIGFNGCLWKTSCLVGFVPPPHFPPLFYQTPKWLQRYHPLHSHYWSQLAVAKGLSLAVSCPSLAPHLSRVILLPSSTSDHCNCCVFSSSVTDDGGATKGVAVDKEPE